jgi:UDP-N-acetylglucosamine acyltransferase
LSLSAYIKAYNVKINQMKTAIQLATEIGIDQFKVNRETGTVIHHTAVLCRGVELSNNVYIGPYCIIGFPAEKKSMHNIGKVLICDNAMIHGSVTIDSGSDSITIIGQGSYIMKQVHIGHDVVINPEVTISPGARVGGHCRIGTMCNIGMNAVIHQYVSIPTGCMIGMGAKMIKGEYKRYRKYVEVGRDIGENTHALMLTTNEA